MNKINKITSTAVPLPIENIDTDQIIPSRFLKSTTRKNFGEKLFRDWRFKKNGEIIKNFILNNSSYKGEILITGNNFGCGSSREHAIWAILDYGFKVVISSFFADIFKNNALNNGLLIIELSNKILKNIFNLLNFNPLLKIKINLTSQTIDFNKKKEIFYIDKYRKKCLLNGYDDIDFLINIKKEIKIFENNHKII